MDGVSFVYDGQRYEFLSTEPYVRKDGVETTLLVFHSMCARCTDGFIVKFPVSTVTPSPSRRCSACRTKKRLTKRERARLIEREKMEA